MLAGFLDASSEDVKIVPASAEEAYLEQLADNVLDTTIIARAMPSVVYTNIHGTGDVMILPALTRLGVHVATVAAQRAHDPRFPTVQSPNPENAEAFTLAIEEARHHNADIVIGTDPDDDRVGAAARERDGTYRLLSGNLIGSALAAYRITRMKELGIIPNEGTAHATLVKTFVTTPLQDAIAAMEGVRCVNTLTGFKWIGAKLGKYQAQAETALPPSQPYDALPWRKRAALLQKHATFFIFGGEESYGYLGTDSVRDKDGNAAALMIVELAAWLKAHDLTFSEYLAQIYQRCGYHAEDLLNINLEGADGARRIQAILKSLREKPPTMVDGAKVIAFHDFARQEILDSDSDLVPKEDFYFFTLEDGRRFAVRGSGTEPKIKYYIFAKAPLKKTAEIEVVKTCVSAAMESLKNWLRTDAFQRTE